MWEAAVWAGGALLAVPAAQRLALPLKTRLNGRFDLLEGAAPWLHGLVPPFAALFTGAVPASYLGLYGSNSPAEWVLGGGLTLALLLGVREGLLRSPLAAPPLRLQGAVLDEPRWALYRAAGRLWLGSLPLGSLVGLGLATAEWSLRHQVWREDQRQDPGVCLVLIRIAWSNLLFALTANFWWVLAFQITWLLLLERFQEKAPS